MPNAAAQPVKLLIVEEKEEQAVLLVEALRQGGFAPTWERVASPMALRGALARGSWDAVLSNHHLPGFTYTTALVEMSNLRLNLPLLLIGRGLDEDVITRAMRLGVRDYISMERLGRLGPALQRELRMSRNQGTPQPHGQELEREPDPEPAPAAGEPVQPNATLNHLAMAVDQAVEAVFITDLDGRLIYVNPAFETTTGYAGTSALGQRLSDLLPDFPAQESGLILPWQGRIATRDLVGSRLVLEGTLNPVRGPKQTVATFVGVLRNITQESDTERNIRHIEKMDALGALASGVAHDFNNILTAILSASELIEWQVSSDSPILPKLHVIYQAVNRARELNRQILSFSRSTEDKFQPFDLSSVVKEAIYLLRTTFPANVEVRTDITSSIWVMGDPNQLHQVVMNLAINGLQAILPQGGSLELILDEGDVGPTPLPNQPTGLDEGRYAVLTVKDSGCGMDALTLERIFEPFFTTKAAREGTGLGLSVVAGIVHKHNGAMAVDSHPGQGTCFQLYFPCTSRDMPEADEKAADNISGQERILLVDDEEVLAALGKQGLQMLGYRVTARSDAQEALDEFQHRPQDFDLLVTDLSMPGLSGVELTNRLRKVRPDLPAILITGAFQAPPSMEGITTPFDDLIFKPISIQDMAKSIRRVFSMKPVPKPVEELPAKGGLTAQAGPSVLLAEDSNVTRMLLRSWLTKAGYRVQVAKDGQEAWEAFTQAQDSGGFSLILTDIVMPRLDGLKLAAKIREVDSAVPVVILSTSEDADLVKEAINLHVNEFLTKPFESAVLINCVERMCAAQATRIKGLRNVETAQAVRMAQRAMEAIPEKDMPIYSISEPLTDAGGDVFRCHRVGDDSIFFAIADVAGHSVISSYAVAAYLGMLSNFVNECEHLRPLQDKAGKPAPGSNSCPHFGADRCEPLRHLAMKLNRTIQTGPFAEVPICSLFGLWTPGTGRLHLLNAGIPHALWYRQALGRTCPVDINGAPLGILDDPPLEEKVIAMEPGDRLLLGSDGFFDAVSAENTPFEATAPSLWRDLTCTDILNAINLVSEAARVHASGRFSDDLLVVGLEQLPFALDHQRFQATFPAQPEQIDRICDELTSFLDNQDSFKTSSRRFDMLLAVREAMSNAMCHASPNRGQAWISLRAQLDGHGQLRVAVIDEGLGFDLPGYEPPDTNLSERGRGIPLIRHFAQEIVMTGGELLMTFDPHRQH